MFMVFIVAGREEGSPEHRTFIWVNYHSTGFHKKYYFFHFSRMLVAGSNGKTNAINIHLAYKKQPCVSDWSSNTANDIFVVFVL